MKKLVKISIFLLLPLFQLSGAEITWDAENGYQSDEIELSGLLPEEINRVLNWMNSGRKAEEKKSYRAALRRYKRVVKKYPKSQYAPEAYSRIAQIGLARNRIDDAFEAFEKIAWVYPNYGSFNQTIGEMYKIAYARLHTYRGKIFWILPGFKNTDRANTYFERIIYIAPYSDYAPLSLMNIAQTWDKKGEDDMAIYALDRLVLNYSDSLLAPDAYLKLAKTHSDQTRGPYYDQSSTENAITFFQDFLYQYPENAGVAIAEEGLTEAQNQMALSKLKIADFYYYKRSRLESAKVIYNEAITIAPKSKTAAVARKKLDEIQKKLDLREEISEKKQKAKDAALEKKVKTRAKRKVLGIF